MHALQYVLAPGSARASSLVVTLLGAVAFVNALGAVIVFPLTPFLALDLGVPIERAALASTCFAAAAGVGGLLAAVLLSRLDGRSALLLSLAGLSISTAAANLAGDFSAFLASRVAAGLVAGPLLAVVMGLAAKAVGAGDRARAIGAVVGSYGLALLAGSPLAILLMTCVGGWRAAFGGLAVLALGLAIPAIWLVQPDGAATRAPGLASLRSLARTPGAGAGLALIAAASFSSLLVSPMWRASRPGIWGWTTAASRPST